MNYRSLVASIAAANNNAAVILLRDDIRADMASGGSSGTPLPAPLVAEVNKELDQIDNAKPYRTNFFHLNNGAALYAEFMEYVPVDPGYVQMDALLTQSGTNDVSVKTLGANTIGEPVPSRGGPGRYTLTLAGAFPASRTQILTGQDITNQGAVFAFKATGDTIEIETDLLSAVDGAPIVTNPSDDVLTNFPISIRVFNEVN